MIRKYKSAKIVIAPWLTTNTKEYRVNLQLTATNGETVTTSLTRLIDNFTKDEAIEQAKELSSVLGNLPIEMIETKTVRV